ncbi:hypothetical protein [Methylobacterium sp. WL9]|uniref:hypothetical protein n=1 Tax=Methylobacterium sp. WL9 TaxID=2603898 RepID=UPI0011C71BDA|nr:hypothetical protein [Methylobacterium sp. WL9]TXN21284.1 hypothetical protein FV217_14910 [Methylobacterium sp. WL9]
MTLVGRALIAAVVIAAAPHAWAQSESAIPTEAQKRRIHLPYVRSATDCLARAVLAGAEPTRLARLGQWFPAISATQKGICLNEISGLIGSHDQLYGAGSGKVFFEGPYFADLPRALGNRLRPEFERLATAELRAETARREEADRAEVERKTRVEQNERAFFLLRDKMYACTTRQVSELVNSAESAEVIATAAMTICRDELSNALRAGEIWLKAKNPGSESSTMQAEIEKLVKQSVVTTAVTVKSAHNTPKSTNELSAATPPLKTTTNVVVTENQPSARPSTVSAGTTECLRAVAKAREGKFVNREALIQAMLDLCRPEIESAARNAFLNDDKLSLDKLRERSLADALQEARAVVGFVN